MKYIVSDEHMFIYFVIPKVACSSIKAALLPIFDFDTPIYETTLKDGAPGYNVHQLFDESGHQVNQRELISELNDAYQEYFKFAFVRNPWDRLVSCYFQKLWDVEKTDFGKPALKLPGGRGYKLYMGMPFAEFVETVYEIPDAEANAHFKSQYKTICGPERDKPIMADFVGRYENLAADFSVVAERIGGTEKLQLPHILRSKSRESRPYTEFYDARLKKLVYERYQEDIEIFGYSFADPQSPPPLWRREGRAGSRRSEQDTANRSLGNQIRNLRERNIHLKRQLKVLGNRNRNLERELQDIRSSKSWRLLDRINRFTKRSLRFTWKIRR